MFRFPQHLRATIYRGNLTALPRKQDGQKTRSRSHVQHTQRLTPLAGREVRGDFRPPAFRFIAVQLPLADLSERSHPLRPVLLNTLTKGERS